MTPEEIKKSLDDIGTKLDAKLQEYTDNIPKIGEDLRKEMKGEIEVLAKDFKAMQDQLDKIDVKLQGNQPHIIKTLEEIIAEGCKDIRSKYGSGNKRKFNIELPQADLLTKTTGTTLTTSNTPGVLVPERLATGIIYAPDRRVHVRDIVPVGSTTSSSLTFPYESSITDATDLTSEGAAKNNSVFALAIKTWNVRKISNYVKCTEELMDDIPALSSYISARFSVKLLNKEDSEFLYSATSNATGLTVEASAYVDVLAMAGIDRFAILRMACAQLTKDEYFPSAILMHPTDIANLDLTQDSTYNYKLPWVFGGNRNIAGVPIIESTAITAGDFLVGDFRQGCQIFDRKTPSIMVYDQNEDDVIKNVITIVFEERVALVVYRGASFVYGDFASALANGSA